MPAEKRRGRTAISSAGGSEAGGGRPMPQFPLAPFGHCQVCPCVRPKTRRTFCTTRSELGRLRGAARLTPGGAATPRPLTLKVPADLGGLQQRQHQQRPQDQHRPAASRAESHCSERRTPRPRGSPTKAQAARAGAAPPHTDAAHRRRARRPSRRLPPNDQIGRGSRAGGGAERGGAARGRGPGCSGCSASRPV